MKSPLMIISHQKTALVEQQIMSKVMSNKLCVCVDIDSICPEVYTIYGVDDQRLTDEYLRPTMRDCTCVYCT